MSDPSHQEHHRHMFHDEADAQHRRDTEQLAKFGYKQELRRSLGFFSTFAIAFSFISATNGFYALFFYGLDVGGPAALIWSWPIVVFGQLMVCLVFAEAASHYPLAGGIYQWAKRLVNGTWAWFVAWMFVAALIVTVAAVAYPVGGTVIAPLFRWDANNTNLLLGIAIVYTLGPMLLNIFSVKITAFFNNIGTVTEMIGLVVIAIALYAAVIFGKGDHQSLSVLFDQGGTATGHAWGYGGAFIAAMLTSAWVLYGFDTAGGLAEETVNPTREVPRAMISAVLITAAISAFWLVAMVLAIPDVAKTQAQTTNAIGYIFDAHFSRWVTDAFLVSVAVAIFVCCLAIQAATSRLLFAYGRDKMVPASRFFGYVHPKTRTPMASALFLAAAVVVLVTYVSKSSDPASAFARITAWATAGTYIAYQMVVVGAIYARSKGWPKSRAYFNLGRWGWPINLIALFYGVFMIINLSWPRSPTLAWYDNYIVVLAASIVLAAGIIVYLIQRVRGVDVSATIHEIELAPEQAEAMAGIEGAEFGETTPPAAAGAAPLEMSGDDSPGIGPVSVDPPSGPQTPGGPQT